MSTVWDWLTLFCFAGLVTLLLHRSSKENPPDKLWHYAPPALACAVANYLGNEGQPLAAALVLVIGGALAYKFLWVAKA